jgi:hypothetical protein
MKKIIGLIQGWRKLLHKLKNHHTLGTAPAYYEVAEACQ